MTSKTRWILPALAALLFMGLIHSMFVGASVFKAEGAIESTTGGFVFPDGTVQTTAAAAPGTFTEYRIVGTTHGTTDGCVSAQDVSGNTIYSFDAMNRLCEIDFGNKARAAFTNEQLAPWITSSGLDRAWIRPTNIEVVYDPDAAPGEEWLVFDTAAAGARGDYRDTLDSALRNISCNQFISCSTDWHGLSRRGGYGDFRVIQCSTEVPIACSAPVVIPY